MQIHSFSSTANAAATTSSTSNSTNANDQLSPNAFIQLLTAQLQAQDPTNPMDPTEFVDQLVQFNILQQVTQIDGLIANGANVTAQAAASGSAAQSTGTN
jgi:flagellar basal-body rod modification protein FlgD